MTISEQPVIEQHPATSYAFVGDTVRMDQIDRIAGRLPEVFETLAGQGLEPTGAPFLRYRTIDMPQKLRIEACVPIDTPLPATGPVSVGTLPGGRYAVLTHRGHVDGLQDSTARLLMWAEEQDLDLDIAPSEDGDVWAGRIEILRSDPATEPDPANWLTLVAIKLAD